MRPFAGRAVLAAQGSETTVRVRVGAVIPIDGRIVLVRHRKDDRVYHLLPGGGVEPGETLTQALVREVAEETGLEVRPLQPLLLNDTIAPDGSRHVVNITFLCEAVGGRVRDSVDERVEGVELVDPGRLRELDLRPPIAETLIEEAGTGFIGAARYLGALWRDEDAGPTNRDIT